MNHRESGLASTGDNRGGGETTSAKEWLMIAWIDFFKLLHGTGAQVLSKSHSR